MFVCKVLAVWIGVPVLGGLLIYGVGYCSFVLVDRWQDRPLSPRRRLKLAKRRINAQVSQVIGDMEAAKNGVFIYRGGQW